MILSQSVCRSRAPHFLHPALAPHRCDVTLLTHGKRPDLRVGKVLASELLEQPPVSHHANHGLGPPCQPHAQLLHARTEHVLGLQRDVLGVMRALVPPPHAI
eukprot:CAMPEP_0202858270 /NCGR_PEP_ID=MMETSP1391-20130828/874_1 /ASSEMBLY_ACC=CAM_ASM_000867 /TAXON_ID=1034604 /ORGANISM="Chlamydomonas leiostraca, Strain SAG 11-49" /LENGTH=101 /DNA_ID=CAMNT_0049537169 /DNA_START=371 /DNA_END=676 /DNA_ORIENTATION=-